MNNNVLHTMPMRIDTSGAAEALPGRRLMMTKLEGSGWVTRDQKGGGGGLHRGDHLSWTLVSASPP